MEILEDGFLNGRKFEIDDKEWTVTEAWNDMISNPEYTDFRDENNRILPEFLEKIPMFKLNQQWINECKLKNFTIIDIGAPPNSNRSSLFYDMEVNTVNWDK